MKYLFIKAMFCIFLHTGMPLVIGQDSPCSDEKGRNSILILGEVYGKHAFSQPFENGMVFALVPRQYGWNIAVYENSKMEFDLARLTLPLRGPRPTGIMGGHFRNKSNTGPNKGEINAPQLRREFIFSPKTREIVERRDEKGISVDIDDIHEIEKYGRGELVIEDYGLADLEEGMMPRMVYMKFRVCLSWPK